MLISTSNGAVKEYITPGVSKDVFVSRLSAAVGGSTAPLSPHEHAAETSTPLAPHEHVTMTVEDQNPDGTTTVVSETDVAPAAVQGILNEMDADPSFIRNESPETERIAFAAANAHMNRQRALEPEAPDSDNNEANLYSDSQTAQPYTFSPPAPAGTSPHVAAILAESKAAHDQAQKDERAAEAARRKADLESSDPKRATETKYALQAKKKIQQEKAERERILKQIEDNRAEQKARQEEAKLAREAAQQKISNHPARGGVAPAVRRGDTCALQIRLFDGSTIRKTFSSRNTLGKEVREWIDAEQQIAGSPYTFKQILAPQPSKTISAGEEEEGLQELGLLPNATLVLVPIKSYNTAYESRSGVTGVATGAASAGVGLVGGAVGLIGSGLGWGARALGSVLGGTSTSDAAGTTPAGRSQPQQQDNQSRERNQFYNGNSVSTPFIRDSSSSQ